MKAGTVDLWLFWIKKLNSIGISLWRSKGVQQENRNTLSPTFRSGSVSIVSCQFCAFSEVGRDRNEISIVNRTKFFTNWSSFCALFNNASTAIYFFFQKIISDFRVISKSIPPIENSPAVPLSWYKSWSFNITEWDRLPASPRKQRKENPGQGVYLGLTIFRDWNTETWPSSLGASRIRDSKIWS
jgi:hypothetical protein